MATRATKASKDPQTATQTGGGSVFAFATGQTGSQLAPGELVVSERSDRAEGRTRHVDGWPLWQR